MTTSQASHANLSLVSVKAINKIEEDSSEASLNELHQVEQQEVSPDETSPSYNKPSTTEYLPGMVNSESPPGLLPQFSSWSITCLGPSSLYSHNSGLLEHFQSGFLSGANYLLPWELQTRYKSTDGKGTHDRYGNYRRRGGPITLKIFLGYEYECPRGHRFFMGSPDKVLNGNSAITKNSGSKLVMSDMPLYFPCPCRTIKNMVAQLMRIHIVTPKSTINVLIDPKVRTGERNLIFSLGLSKPAKLTPSAYWMVRLPYVYQGEEGPIPSPSDVGTDNAVSFGSLLGSMFTLAEENEQ